MKLYVMRFLTVLAAVFTYSCASVIPDYPSSRSWFMSNNETAGIVWISSITVDKASGWASVESEIADLLPLLLLQNSFIQAQSPDQADLFVEAKLREREYTRGWNMERSLSVEIYFRSGISDNGELVSAGQVMSRGNKSFSSSAVLSNMLEQALKQAIKVMVKK